MARHVVQPALAASCGNLPKVIREFIGRVSTRTGEVSIAHMESPGGWEEPGQCPAFSEYTVVLEGVLHVKTRTQDFEVKAFEAVIVPAGEWVRYSTPSPGGAKYLAVCLPAFSPQTVRRDEGALP